MTNPTTDDLVAALKRIACVDCANKNIFNECMEAANRLEALERVAAAVRELHIIGGQRGGVNGNVVLIRYEEFDTLAAALKALDDAS